MNLASNAIKYTEAGFVRVQLSCKEFPSLDKDRPTSHVSLSITDSGRGISEEYLRHHLYTPFAQENDISSGTGLGLSIVHQIIKDVNGEIDVKSELRQGTSVMVDVTLEKQMQSDQAKDPQYELAPENVRKYTKGRSVCLVGFDTYPDIKYTAPSVQSTDSTRMAYLKQSIAHLCSDWFEMTIASARQDSAGHADVYISTEAAVEAAELRTNHGADDSTTPRRHEFPRIVLCGKPSDYHQDKFPNVVYLSQP
jgi:hypothetical protein